MGGGAQPSGPSKGRSARGHPSECGWWYGTHAIAGEYVSAQTRPRRTEGRP